MASANLEDEATSAAENVANMTNRAERTVSAHPADEHRFPVFPQLPPEIKMMILEAAGLNARAHIYSGRQKDKLEFQQLIKLATAFPDFKKFLEQKLGFAFKSLNKNPDLAVRGAKDLLVFTMQKTPIIMPGGWLQYARQCKRHLRSHGIFAPNIQNIGIRFDQPVLHGLQCSLQCWPNLTNQLHGHMDMKFCPSNLAAFAKNFSHVQNVFVVIPLKIKDFIAKTTKEGVKDFIQHMERQAYRQGLMVFTDQKRTWVEAKDVQSLDNKLATCIEEVFFELEMTKRAFIAQDNTIKYAAYPRKDVGFRVLFAPYIISPRAKK